MKNELITLETAKLAKEKGFDFLVLTFFQPKSPNEEEYEPSYYSYFNWNAKENYYSRPTQSLLARWLRDIHGIHVTTKRLVSGFFLGQIDYFPEDKDEHIVKSVYGSDNPKETVRGTGKFFTHEDAMEIALWEALKLI